MATWLWSGTSTANSTAQLQFDTVLSEVTSENLPTPSLDEFEPESFERSLDLSDLVRSGQLKPVEAIKLLKKRLAATINPNVQLRTMLVLDTLIKNSGDAFLRELATSTPLIEDISDLIRRTINHQVKQNFLKLYQNWALAFQSKPHLSISELVLTYTRLKQEGQPFPSAPSGSTAGGAMLDSLSAPQWIANQDSNLCSRCRDAFTLTNRRHHCRNCGQLFDQKCSAQSLPLPHFGITTPVRVCDGCFKKISSGNPTSGSVTRRHTLHSSTNSPSSRLDHHSRSNSYSSYSRSSVRNREDEDLQMALRLSLQESSNQSSYAPSSSGYRPNYASDSKIQEEDPDLAAAIAASLKDMENAPSAPTDFAPRQQQPYSAQHQEVPSFQLPPNKELSASNLDSLLSFSQATLKARTDVQANPGALGLVVNDLSPQYQRAELARKSLVSSVKDAAGKESVLVDTKEKLREIMRLYESVLERQVARHTGVVPHQVPPQTHPNASAYGEQIFAGSTYQSNQSQMYPSINNLQPSQPEHVPVQNPNYVPNAPLQSPSAVEQQQYSYNTFQPQIPPQEMQYNATMPQAYPLQSAYEQHLQHYPESAPPLTSPTLEQPQTMPSMYPPVSSPSIQQVALPSQTNQQQSYAPPLSSPQLQQQQAYTPQRQASFSHPDRQPYPVQPNAARSVSLKQYNAQQLQSLPHAPQTNLYNLQSFPSVPDVELPTSQPSRQPEMLIEL